MKKYGLIFLLSLLFTPLAISANICIRIFDIYHNPINKAKIILNNNFFLTDTSGKTSIDISSKKKKVKIKIVKDGYFPKTVLISPLSQNNIKVYIIPKKNLKESIVVTALNYKEKSIDTPISENDINSIEIKEDIPENIVNLIKDTTGVYFIGKGGYSITPSIRGLGRRRILTMIDGIRIVSDRSVGTSASFIPTGFIDKIEIIRSPISVLYGTDAIGGVINIFSLQNNFIGKKQRFLFNYKPSSNRIDSSFSINRSFEDYNIVSGFNILNSGDYSSPEGKIYNSGYTLFSGLLRINKKWGDNNLFFEYLGSYGKNIGKPSRKNDPDKKKIYPYENNHIINMGYSNKSLINNGEIKFNIFLNPYNYKLEKIDNHENKNSISKTESLNGGIKMLIKKVYGKLIVQTGLDYYSRNNINIENIEINNNVKTDDFYPVKNGRRDDLGFFTTFDYAALKDTDIIFGTRYNFYRIKNMEYNNHLNGLSMYIGMTKKIGKHISLFSSIGNGHRIPSINEAAYTGISGRGTIIANPNLLSEKSLNIDGGIKIYNNNFFIGAYLFQTKISNIIDKFDLGNDLYTYMNIDSGIIKGFESEFQYYPFKFWEISGNYIHYKGTTDTNNLYLNDIPPNKLFLKSRFFYDRFYFETDYLYVAKKDNPGPAEIVNDSFNLINIKTGFYYSDSIYLFLKISNLLNSYYYANADPKIPPQEERSVSIGVNYNF